MDNYQSPDQAVDAEQSLADMPAFAARFGPLALWQPADPAAAEREKAEKEAKEREGDNARQAVAAAEVT